MTVAGSLNTHNAQQHTITFYKFLFVLSVLISTPKIGFSASPLAQGYTSNLQLAELYKWQDNAGMWHFSDNPPPQSTEGGQPSPNVERLSEYDREAEDTDSMSDEASNKKDLAARLAEKYPTDSLIAQVTLGVVTIETSIGYGSGFFITSDGYIITNKHVVRPTSTKALDNIKTEIKQSKLKFEKIDKDLAQERTSLERIAQKLKQQKKYLDSKGLTHESAIAETEYRAYKERYDRRKRDYDAALHKHEKQKSAFAKKVDDFNFKSTLSGVAQRFKVFLKDNSEHQATLISLSKNYDLALLQLTDAHTPVLTFHDGNALPQGSNVFAIGSPMGFRDAVTKGIITGYRDHYVISDTKILPGNSGGPLVTEEGHVVGVNTIKVAKEVTRQGFGLAIPITTIKQEFRRYLPQNF